MLQNEPTLAIVAVDTEENERLRFGVNYSVYSFTSLAMIGRSPLIPTPLDFTKLWTSLSILNKLDHKKYFREQQ